MLNQIGYDLENYFFSEDVVCYQLTDDIKEIKLFRGQ